MPPQPVVSRLKLLFRDGGVSQFMDAHFGFRFILKFVGIATRRTSWPLHLRLGSMGVTLQPTHPVEILFTEIVEQQNQQEPAIVHPKRLAFVLFTRVVFQTPIHPVGIRYCSACSCACSCILFDSSSTIPLLGGMLVLR